MPTATLTSKGQITIPIEVRKALGLESGDKIDFVELEKGQYVIKARTGSIMAMMGCIPKLGYAPTIEEMDQAILDGAAENYLASIGESPSSDKQGEAA